MDIITITLLVLAVLVLGGWGYGYYAATPAPGVVTSAPGPSPVITLLGFVGLILVVAFIVLLATGWRFGLDVTPP